MKAALSVLFLKHTLRTATFAALVLGLVAMAPAYASDQLDRKAGLYNSLATRHAAPANSAHSERSLLAAGTELLSDGGFEVGPSPSGTFSFTTVSSAWTWQSTGSQGTPDPRYYSISTGTSAAHGGNWCLYFDLGPSTDRLYQTITIPSGVTATLSFWIKIGGFESSANAYDTLKASIASQSGVPLSTVTFSNLDETPSFSWVQRSYDVSAFAGQTVRLQFDTVEDATADTIFMIDDVSIRTSASNVSCVEDALTMCLVNGRYKVTSHWKNQFAGGATANLSKSKLTDKTGAFWIADGNTYEYLIRFNTATNNGRIWIAIPTFTDVEFWVSVTDTIGGQSKEYHSNPGNQSLIYDPFYFVYP